MIKYAYLKTWTDETGTHWYKRHVSKTYLDGSNSLSEDVGVIHDLDGLKSVLIESDSLGCDIDTDNLPTFGGQPPADTVDVGSWDKDFAMLTDFTIVHRSEL